MGFQAGLSGLNANAKYIDLLGNNVANSNTIGFKGASPRFADVFANSFGGGGSSGIGLGAQLKGTSQLFTQGNLVTTSNPSDLAVNGNGFFKLSNKGAISYTRNGQFTLDKSGYMVAPSGERLQGYLAKTVTSGGITTIAIDTSSTNDLKIASGDVAPNPTASTEITANLDANAKVPATAVFNVTDPTSYNNVASLSFYDSLGNQHTLSMYTVKGANPNDWTVNYALDGAAAGVAPATTSLTFDTGGVLQTPNAATALTITLANGAVTPQAISLDLTKLTQYGSPFAVSGLAQDGNSSGQLVGFNIGADGLISGKYSNGQTKPLGQVALATFQNQGGLAPVGSNQWQETALSGQANVGTPGSGITGVLQSASLEESNVDLTAELVNMITAQRSYQANAQTIKTQDQVLSTLVNLR